VCVVAALLFISVSASFCQPVPTEAVADTASAARATARLSASRISEATAPIATTSTDTIALGRSDLWICGHHVRGSHIAVQFTGDTVVFGDARLPIDLRPTARSDSTLRRVFSQVPGFADHRLAGFSVEDCVTLYFSARDSLEQELREACRVGGEDAALSVLRRSPLVEDVDLAGQLIKYRGLPVKEEFHSTFWALEPAPPRNLEKDALAHHLVNRIKAQVQLPAGLLVIVTRGGSIDAYEGKERDAVNAQLSHLEFGGRLDALPPGPLLPTSSAVREVFDVVHSH